MENWELKEKLGTKSKSMKGKLGTGRKTSN